MEAITKVIDSHLGQLGEVLPAMLDGFDAEDAALVRNLVRLAFVQGYAIRHKTEGQELDLALAASVLWPVLNVR